MRKKQLSKSFSDSLRLCPCVYPHKLYSFLPDKHFSLKKKRKKFKSVRYPGPLIPLDI